jgi:hypothetical protein
MDVKECQQCMNIFYNSNIYRDRIYHRLLYNNDFYSRETNCIINNLKKMFEKTVNKNYINSNDYNNLFPIIDNNTIKKFFRKDNITGKKRKIKEINFKKLYNQNLDRLYLKNPRIKDYYASNTNYYYIKFAVNERYEKNKENLDKTLYEYYYNIFLFSLNNKKLYDIEINNFFDNIIINSSCVKIYYDNLNFINKSINYFGNYITFKKKNIYKLHIQEIKNDKSTLINFVNNLLDLKKINVNKLGIIRPYGYLSINGKDSIFDNRSFFFNKHLNSFNLKNIIYDNIGLIFFKNYYNSITLDFIHINLKMNNTNIELKEYTFELFDKALFQLIFTLFKINNYYDNFRHNDLHFKNVIVNSKKKNHFYLIENNVYYIKNVNIKLIDFEMSSLGEDNLINHYISNEIFLNDYGLSNISNNSYDIHYVLNIIYSHNLSNIKYRDFVLRHINKEYLGRNNSYVNEWRLKKDIKLEINYKNILNDTIFKKFRILKFKK